MDHVLNSREAFGADSLRVMPQKLRKHRSVEGRRV